MTIDVRDFLPGAKATAIKKTLGFASTSRWGRSWSENPGIAPSGHRIP